MQQKSVNNVAMESKAYSLVKQIKETGALFNADHIYCNPPQLENENNKKETVNNLKSMLILHLEVVKEQAEQILSKDKLIAKLRQENEELKSRLDKYEQRRSQHPVKRMSSLSATPDDTMVVTTNNNINKKSKGRPPSITNHVERIISSLCTDNVASLAYRNNCVSPAKRQEFTESDEKTPSKRRKIDKRKQINEQTPVKGQICPTEDPYEFTVDEPNVPKQLRETSAVSSLITTISEENPVGIKKLPFITTNTDYILCNWQKSDAELDAEAEPVLRASLEIPSWSIKERHVCSSHSIEVMEDLSDDAFMKRHTKFETDERRRKKWDVQRLREQKQVERLKKRYLKDEYDEKERKMEHKSITSFYPSPDNIKYIQLVEELPVLAFGEPIPCIPQGDFTFSWMNSDKSNMSPTTCFTKTRFFCKRK